MVNTQNVVFKHFISQRWRGCAATIEDSPNCEVYGVLWELDRVHLATLDRQEGVKTKVYRRFEVKVT